MQFFTRMLILIICLTAGRNMFAQSDTTTFLHLDEVVVTGQYSPQSLKKSVYQVRVIGAERILLSGAANLQQVLSHELGFRFSHDNTLGISDMKLNGMGGTNIKILLDGVPLPDRYDERVSISQIDINNIERIEIVEGPMSVSFGSDAMAGVVNIITKKIKKNSFSVSAQAREETASREYFPFSYKGAHMQNMQVNMARGRWRSSAGGSHKDMNGFGGDEYGRGKSWKPKEQWLGNGMIGYKVDQWDIYYRLDGLNENIVVRNPINMNNYKATDQQYLTSRFVHQIQSEYNLNDRMKLNSFVAFTDYARQTKTTRRDFESGTLIPNQAGEEDVSHLNSLSFKTTMKYTVSQALSLQPGMDINHERAGGDRIAGRPEINDFAFFLSAEITPFVFMSIRPGVRFSRNSVYEAPPVIPSLNTKFVLNKELDLRFAYGYGFRAPALRELYLTFYDANHSLVGNTDLKAEFSNSVNGSLTFNPSNLEKNTFRSTLSGFYTAYQNQIELVQSVTHPSEYTYHNTNKSRAAGGRLENVLHWKKLAVSVGLAYVGFSSSAFENEEFVNEDSRSFLWSPEINSDIAFRWDKMHTSFAVYYKFTGRKPAFSLGMDGGRENIVLTTTAAYHLADFSLRTEMNKYFSFQAGVRNIFDVTTVHNNTLSSSSAGHSGAGPVSISYGRSFFAGLHFTWNKK